MRPDLLEILRCPVCRHELSLTVEARDGEEIVRGNLACSRCRVNYPITDGIPNLLPPDERD
jgi:uncharacterized protein YbaR (Trm112 family)